MEEKKIEEDISIFQACLWIFVPMAIAAVFLMNRFAGPAYSGVRGVLSGDIHHAACLLKMCDEDGRCPVWADKYGKCYMLGKYAREFLKEYEKETSKEAFEEVFVK